MGRISSSLEWRWNFLFVLRLAVYRNPHAIAKLSALQASVHSKSVCAAFIPGVDMGWHVTSFIAGSCAHLTEDKVSFCSSPCVSGLPTLQSNVMLWRCVHTIQQPMWCYLLSSLGQSLQWAVCDILQWLQSHHIPTTCVPNFPWANSLLLPTGKHCV